jgi:hypothetical protein
MKVKSHLRVGFCKCIFNLVSVQFLYQSNISWSLSRTYFFRDLEAYVYEFMHVISDILDRKSTGSC